MATGTGFRRRRVNYCLVPDEELIEAAPAYKAIAVAINRGRDSLATEHWIEFRRHLNPQWHNVDLNSISRRVTSLAKSPEFRHLFRTGIGHGPRKAPDYKVPPEWEDYVGSPEFVRKEKDTIRQRGGKCTVCTRVDDVKMHITDWAKVPNEPSSYRILLCWRCRRRQLSDLCPECEKRLGNGDDFEEDDESEELILQGVEL